MNTSPLVLVLVVLQAGSAAAQPAPAAQRRLSTRPAASEVVVRDRSGAPLGGVKVIMSGPASQTTTTGLDGIASLSPSGPGVYRLRFERDGFVTLEREVTVRSGQRPVIDVALSKAPEPPPPPPAPPAPPPPAAPSSVASAPSGPPVFVSIPQFLDKNYIGREPLKESVLGCLADSTTRLLQLHDGIGEHTHADMDEVLYIVAGEGAVRVRDDATPVSAGTLGIVPHGQPHAIERRGRNPLMVLSVLSGVPCRAAQTQAAAR